MVIDSYDSYSMNSPDHEYSSPGHPSTGAGPAAMVRDKSGIIDLAHGQHLPRKMGKDLPLLSQPAKILAPG